jgi:hypothetical protein
MSEVLDLQKNVLDLSKAFELNLTKAGLPANLRMQARLAIDRSPSMYDEFACGWVAKAVDIFLGAALRFDDDGNLTVGAFDEGFKSMPDATIEDAGVYVRKHGLDATGNGTNYGPVIKNMAHLKKPGFFGRLFGGSAGKDPVYLGMITDGDCQDRGDFEAALHDVKASESFIHIFGIGNQVNVRYMQQIANRHPNVAFDHIPDPHGMTAETFYTMMCDSKFAAWVKTNITK